MPFEKSPQPGFGKEIPKTPMEEVFEKALQEKGKSIKEYKSELTPEKPEKPLTEKKRGKKEKIPEPEKPKEPLRIVEEIVMERAKEIPSEEKPEKKKVSPEEEEKIEKKIKEIEKRIKERISEEPKLRPEVKGRKEESQMEREWKRLQERKRLEKELEEAKKLKDEKIIKYYEERIRKLTKPEEKVEKAQALEAEKRIKEEKLEAEKPPILEKEKTKEELEKELEERRKDYAEAYKQSWEVLAKGKKEKKLKELLEVYEPAIKPVREKHILTGDSEKLKQGDKEAEERKKNFIEELETKGIKEERASAIYEAELKKAEYETAKVEAGKKMAEAGVEKAEIFKKLILNEHDLLNQAKVETWPAKEKNCFRKAMEWWMRRGTASRLLISTGLVTGVVAVAGGFSAPAIAMFAGYRFIRGFGSVMAANLAGKGVDWTMVKGIKAKQEAALEQLRTGFDLDKLKEVEMDYQKILEETAKRERRKLFIKGGVMATVGAGTAIGVGFLEQAWAGPKITPEAPRRVSLPVEERPKAPLPEAPPEAEVSVPEAPPKPQVVAPEEVELKVPAEAIPEAKPEIWEMKVGKGESPLLLAKKLYIEHAEKLGYKPEMGDVTKWAEAVSTRHIVGQYIKEHLENYKDLISKIGEPPKDPIQLNEWLHKVPKSTFNEILHQKVPNLIYEGDVVKVAESGDIFPFSPEGELRTAHIEVITKVPETEVTIPEIAKVKTPFGSEVKLRYYDLDDDGKLDGALLLDSKDKIIEDIKYQPDRQSLVEFTQLTEQKANDWIKDQSELFQKVVGEEISQEKFDFLKRCGIEPYDQEGFNGADIAKYVFLKEHPDLFSQSPERVRDLFDLAQKLNLKTEQIYQSLDKINYETDLLIDSQGNWDEKQFRILESLKGPSPKLIDALGLTKRLDLDYLKELNAARLKIDINNKEAIQYFIGDKYKANKALVWWEEDNLKIQIKRTLRKDIILEPLKKIKKTRIGFRF